MAEASKRGGARPGAGRPRKNPEEATEPVLIEAEDMLDLLQKIALGKTDATALQVRAAIAAVQYTHTRTRDGGKKEAKMKEAQKATGRFAVSEPPKLVAVGGGRK